MAHVDGLLPGLRRNAARNGTHLSSLRGDTARFRPARAFARKRQLLSVRWQRRFALIDQAGGVELPKAYLLTEMQRFWLCFSFPAWVFGPLWYLAKGMWRKAIVLGALCYGAELLVGAVFFLAFGYEMSMSIATLTALVMSYYFFGARAVMDYYKATVLEDRSWL